MGTKHKWTNADGLTRGGGPRAPETNNEIAEKSIDKELSASVPEAGNAPFATIRYVSGPAFAAYDSRSFRQIFQTPFVGPCLVRCRYESDTTSITTVDYSAVAVSDNLTADNPTVAGAASTWTVNSAISISAGSATWTTDGTPGWGYSPWTAINIPSPIDSSGGGYVHVGTRMVSGGRAVVGSPTRPAYDWEQVINGLLPLQRYRAMQNAGGDNISVNQTSFVNATPSGSQYNPCAALEIIPLTGIYKSVAAFGDSITQALGTGTPSVQPHNYNYVHIGAGLELASGRKVVVANYAAEGKSPAFTTQRLINLLNGDTDFRPDVIFLSPFSPNETFDTATINAAFTLAMTAVRICRARGIKLVMMTSLPDAATNTTTDAARQAGNALIRTSGAAYLDRDAIVTNGATPARIQSAYTYDGRHLNRAGNEAIAPYAAALMR